MTHIESTLPEIVGGEVQRLLVSDADGLAAAALYGLVQNATGCRLPQPDGTPSSEVEEMLALCSAVLRRHWQTPLTMLDGLSLQELVSRLMADRVEGDATLGIPAVNGSVTEALSALLERKITGAPEVADGVSLVQTICSNAFVGETLTTGSAPTYIEGSITEITDDNIWDTCVKRIPFRDIKKVQINCKSIRSADDNCLYHGFINSAYKHLEEVEFPYLEILDNTQYGNTVGHAYFICGSPVKKVYLPKLTGFSKGAHYLGVIANCPNIEEIDLPAFVGGNINPGGETNTGFRNNPKLRVLKLTGLTNGNLLNCFNESPNLIHLEISVGLNSNLNLSAQYGTGWSPTTALSSNLLQFLSNFREFLFLRLADRTGQTALTLTLSQAVYQAITGTDTTTTALTLTLNQLGITDLTEKEVAAGITLNTTYATWLETYRDAINWNIGYV